MNRTPQQAEALAAGDRDVFLRAGAGTGKTTVLVDRFCAAALDPAAGVERILAFTFTERAADQLRRRVRAELARQAAGAEGEALEALRDAEEKTERAWISTIHGFCRRLLSSHPAAAGIDPRFRVLDDPEADRLADRAFDAALDELVGRGDPDALELAAANRRASLGEMTRSAYDELRSQGRPSPELPDPPPVDTAARLGELIEAASAAHAESEACKTDLQLKMRGRLAAAMELDPGAEVNVGLLDLLASLKIEQGSNPLKGEECTRYRSVLARTREAVAAEVMRPAYEQLRELVKAFGERYEVLKAERSALDFEDLQLRAVALLEGNERLRDRYREQFELLMVDEFQDTNALQLRLIEALRGPQTRLFMVGDEFQSIYGFRHADVDVYRRAHRRFAEGEEPNGVALPLTGNFRALPEIVAATNAIGRQLLAGFEPLTAGVEADPADSEPVVEMQLVAADKKGWDDADTQLPRLPDDPSPAEKVAEARLLAARLRDLVDAGEDPAEIVVLMRAFTHVGAVERALSEAGLDPYVVGGRGFWSQQQIEDMRALLGVVANPLDDAALFGALASHACGLMPDTLWLLRRAATLPPLEGSRHERPQHIWPLARDLLRGEPIEGDGDAVEAIPAEEMERLLEFARRLESLRARGAEGGLETLVDSVAVSFGYDLATLVRDDGPERWANVRKLMRLAREFESREGPDLAAFISYLGSRAANRDREAEAATRAEGHAGVRVMTVHAAKGLEFGVVAVADLGRGLNLSWNPLRVGSEHPEEDESARVGVQLGRVGRPGERLHDYEELTELAAERGAEEEGRLAYVAVTRAQRRLILSGTYPPKSVKAEDVARKPIALQLIKGVLGGDVAERVVDVPAADATAPAGRVRLTVVAPGPGIGASLLTPTVAIAASAREAAARPPLQRPAEPPALAGGLSYSALAGFKRCGYRFYAERVLGISAADDVADAGTPGDGEEPDGDVADAKHRYGPGVAVHALLEWSARSGWREPDASRAAAALAEEGLEPPESMVERTLELTRAWLESPLREEIGDGAVRSEVPFVLSVSDTLIRGSIDLLAPRGPGEPVMVVDYKTDRLRDLSPADAAGRYEVQSDIYAMAAAAAGSQVVETVYVFLERPDEPVRRSYDAAGLEAARERVAALLAHLAEGEFEVTDRPHRALCHDCPARERLCSHSIESQMRDETEPPIEPPQRGDVAPASAEADAAAEPAARSDPDEPTQMSLLG